MKTKDKFKQGQLVKINKTYKNFIKHEEKFENTGVIIKYNYTSNFSGVSYYDVLWMKDIRNIPDIWIELA